MTNEQILKEAIEKAVKNGWERTSIEPGEDFELKLDWNEFKIITEMYLIGGAKGKDYVETFNLYEILFSHDFAKALWTQKLITRKCRRCGYKAKPHYYYQYHLRQMVLEKEPLKYIKKFL
ncbi:hypothetical protein LCGC14_0641230 [marine sediment metagenome]|uniref:Uncharacterized protein n=1 Tax=marine sediment metagenome TaxID=412755 RepID=A0A0F9U7D9_9ZZZZ|nr:hypothetical protein [archaeon]